jgi:hypothetical protein
MTVVITSIAVSPRESSAPDMANAVPSSGGTSLARAPYEWHPERSKQGMVSVVVSVADQRAIVLRGGVQIGSAPVRVHMPVDRAFAYVVRSWDEAGPHWLKLQFSGAGESMDVSPAEKDRFETPYAFRQAVAASLKLGSVVIVTPESLTAGSPGRSQTVIDNGS